MMFHHAVWLCLVGTALAGQEWWKTAAFYQIYPRSFKDSDGNGVGDINGITSKLDYLQEIGITGAWISPIFKSPMTDFGYDISNYTDVDPTFGTLDDLINLISEIKKRNIKILLDFVPNHTSDQHPWFINSVAMQGDYTDYYVWRNASSFIDGEPQVPNNWQSNFTGSAWEWNEQRQQFYLHQFGIHQPDLNFRNPLVVAEMQNIMKFWLNLGIDGIREDAVKFLVEDDKFLDEPMIDPDDSLYYNNLDHIYTTNQPLTYTIISGWNDIVREMNKDNMDRVLLLEVYDPIEQIISYYGDINNTFAIPFNFFLLEGINKGITAVDLLGNFNEWLDAMPAYGTANWVVGNHDNSRVATKVGVEMADSINMILAMLPGIMVTYNGDEFAMTDTYLTYEETVDSSGKKLGPDHYQEGSRDPQRTPLQWDDTESAGFSTNSTTWLPVNPNYWELNVAEQRATARSHLNVYRSLMSLRRTSTFVSEKTAYEITAPSNSTLIIKRWADEGDIYVLIVNLANTRSTTMYSLTNVTQMRVTIASTNAEYDEGDTVTLSQGIILRPKAAVILQTISSSRSGASSTVVSVVLLLFSFLILF